VRNKFCFFKKEKKRDIPIFGGVEEGDKQRAVVRVEVAADAVREEKFAVDAIGAPASGRDALEAEEAVETEQHRDLRHRLVVLDRLSGEECSSRHFWQGRGHERGEKKDPGVECWLSRLPSTHSHPPTKKKKNRKQCRKKIK